MTDEPKNSTQQPDEPDSFTKSINPEELPDELQEIYKSMQADYTRKTQQLAEMRKEFTEKESTWQEKLKQAGAAEHELKQWRDWYASLEAEVEKELSNPGVPANPAQPSDQSQPGQQTVDPNALKSVLDQELSTLRQTIKDLQGQLASQEDKTKRMFSYHAQLANLRAERGLNDEDQRKVLDYALENGLTDLNRAYKDLYADQLFEEEVQRRVEEALKKERTRGPSAAGSGHPYTYKTPAKLPKTFEEATEQIISDLRAEGKLS